MAEEPPAKRAPASVLSRPAVRPQVLPAKSATVSRKLQKVLDINLDDSFRDSLEYLSSFYTENTARERKNLRGVLEKRALTLHQGFLEEFKKVNDAFHAVQDDVDDLGRVCEGVSGLLHSTQEEASSLLRKATVLQDELQEVQEKEIQVKDFLQRFQLTDEEKNYLTKGEVNPDFFATLHKVHGIHRNCKELLNVNHQQAGIEIMEEMYMFQLAAFERLFKHTHKLCLDLMLADVPDINSNFVACLNALRDRPALWEQCMQEVTKGRRTTLARNFDDAMARVGPTGVRPADTQAHDPIRYAGDMLAWVHQAVAEESELMGNFFHMRDKGSSLSSSSSGSEVLPASKLEVLDSIFEALCKHLKYRLDQLMTSVASHRDSSALFGRLHGVVAFYVDAIPAIVGATGSLSLLLHDVSATTKRRSEESAVVGTPTTPTTQGSVSTTSLGRSGTASS